MGVPRFDPAASFVGYIGVAVDVTDRKRAEEVLYRYAAIVESSDDAIIGTDSQGIIKEWNNGAERLYGYSAGEAIGMQISSLSTPDRAEHLEHILEMVWNGKAVRNYETVRKRKDGTCVDVSLTISPIINSDGWIVGKSGIARDITERKRVQEALATMSRKLIEAQEPERARIARELHDDVCQRLALLAVELEQLRENPGEAQSRLNELREKAGDISNDLQVLSHELHSAKLEYLGLVPGMRSWCKEFGERKGMQIEFKSPPVLHSVTPEISLCLFRVLQEGLHNAAKHSGAKGMEVEISQQTNEVQLVIKDLGRGFDIHEAVQGRGLGLTSMQERVRMINGTVLIDAKPMKGTTILVRVPLMANNASRRRLASDATDGTVPAHGFRLVAIMALTSRATPPW